MGASSSENFILNKFINWYGSIIFKYENKKTSFGQNDLRKEIEQALDKRADSLFPNIIKTAFREYDYEKEKSNNAYTNDYGDFYIFDFDFLVMNKPSPLIKDLSRQCLSQRGFHTPSLCRLYSTPSRSPRTFRFKICCSS